MKTDSHLHCFYPSFLPPTSSFLQIIDFGLAMEKDAEKTLCGTRAYLAPEMWAAQAEKDQKDRWYDAKLDVWAVGIM